MTIQLIDASVDRRSKCAKGRTIRLIGPLHKISALPYLLVTVALGSAGPLLHLVRRFAERPDADAALATRAVHN
jgi:hypothetical protein